jgi:hypothetical protein
MQFVVALVVIVIVAVILFVIAPGMGSQPSYSPTVATRGFVDSPSVAVIYGHLRWRASGFLASHSTVYLRDGYGRTVIWSVTDKSGFFAFTLSDDQGFGDAYMTVVHGDRTMKANIPVEIRIGTKFKVEKDDLLTPYQLEQLPRFEQMSGTPMTASSTGDAVDFRRDNGAHINCFGQLIPEVARLVGLPMDVYGRFQPGGKDFLLLHYVVTNPPPAGRRIGTVVARNAHWTTSVIPPHLDSADLYLAGADGLEEVRLAPSQYDNAMLKTVEYGSDVGGRAYIEGQENPETYTPSFVAILTDHRERHVQGVDSPAYP